MNHLIHYSILFKDSIINHHGEFITTLTDAALILKKAKVELGKKLPDWKRTGEEIEGFEIYDNDRKTIFKYEK